MRRRSPHGHRPGWNLCRVVVKSGDDCRQELMAIQLIKTFQEIFLDARLPLWVSPYEVLVTSNRTALIEFIPDTLSVHSIKHRSPSGTSLSRHFFDKFIKGTPECEAAQRNFVESLAAYSLITYLLQVRERTVNVVHRACFIRSKIATMGTYSWMMTDISFISISDLCFRIRQEVLISKQLPLS